MKPSLTDVAQAAGVSLATASRAYKDPDRLAHKTRQRVLAAANELGYSTGSSNSSLTIGVVVPDSANPVFGAILSAIQEQAWGGRHKIMLADTTEHLVRETEILRSMSSTVNGLILASPRLPGDEIKEIVADVPTVVINADVDFCPAVLMGADAGMIQAFEHLVALGHQHVTYVPGPAHSWADQQRRKMIEKISADHQIQLTVVGNQSATVEGGLAAAAAVVASQATAVLAYNDLVAMGIMAGARQLGKQCPADLSVIGIDDLKIAAVAQPGLTSIRVDISQGGAQTMNLLMDVISGKLQGNFTDIRPSQLIVRGSTDVVPAGR